MTAIMILSSSQKRAWIGSCSVRLLLSRAARLDFGVPLAWLHDAVVGSENHSCLRSAEADCNIDISAREADVGEHAIVKRVQFVDSLSTASVGSERSYDRLDALRERVLESGPAVGPTGQRMSS